MTATPVRWHVDANTSALVRALHRVIGERAAAAIATRGAFSIVLAGGATPRTLYAELAESTNERWDCWHVYFTDERCLPRGDPNRNDTMARAAWLDAVTIPPAQIHAIPAELGPVAGAAAYRRTLRSVGEFDFVLLGLGEDGHTASLFAEQPLGAEPDAPATLAVHAAPKPPAARVTLSAARLARARTVCVLATGAAKHAAISAWRAGHNPVLAAIRPDGGIDAYVDI